MRAVVVGILVALCAQASANGRPPGTSTITFRQGHEDDIVAGTTFGLVISHDGGATWHWMCEDALGYGGLYDPDYAYTASGAIFATTFNGVVVNRNGCTFDATATGATAVSHVELGPDGALYFAASDATDTKIYRSTDDGMTFPQAVMPAKGDVWWSSLVVAPSRPQRIYATSYRTGRTCLRGRHDGDPCTKPEDCEVTDPGLPVCEVIRQFRLFASDDAGASFSEMSRRGLTTTLTSTIDIVGVDPANPDVIYAHVTIEDSVTQEGLYRSSDAGTTWTRMATTHEPVVFLARRNGELVYATQHAGAFHSTDGGMTWTPLAGAPHINCLVENSAGEVWACTVNFTSMSQPQADGFGIMKSTDLATWTGVLRYQDIQGPVSCAPGTLQHDVCEASSPSTWCCLMSQLGITTTDVDCSGTHTCFPPLSTDGPLPGPPKGCCEAGGSGTSLTMTVLVICILRRRRATLVRFRA